jgi:hypothetical protein
MVVASTLHSAGFFKSSEADLEGPGKNSIDTSFIDVKATGGSLSHYT